MRFTYVAHHATALLQLGMRRMGVTFFSHYDLHARELFELFTWKPLE